VHQSACITAVEPLLCSPLQNVIYMCQVLLCSCQQLLPKYQDLGDSSSVPLHRRAWEAFTHFFQTILASSGITCVIAFAVCPNRQILMKKYVWAAALASAWQRVQSKRHPAVPWTAASQPLSPGMYHETPTPVHEHQRGGPSMLHRAQTVVHSKCVPAKWGWSML
jgi:hypothetical protein